MKKLIPFIVFAFTQFSVATAQELEVESAIRNSQNIYQGTARFMGMGGAFSALGADLSSISINPAGVGVYTGFQMEFTPSFQNQLTNTQTNTQTNTWQNKDFSYNLNLNNIGISGSYNLNSPPWKNINFALGYNTMNTFNKKARSEIFNLDKSILHGFVNNANNGNFRSAYEDLAWQTYLLHEFVQDSNLVEYWSQPSDEMEYTDTAANVQEIGVNQYKNLDNSGKLGEYFFAIGANYNNKLYLGMSLGMQKVNYTYKDTYSETERDNEIYYDPDIYDFQYNFHSMSFIQYEDHTGTGYNFKLGAIYRPTDYIRIGASFHSPTYFNTLSYSWYNNMRSTLDNGNSYQETSEEMGFSYKLVTPAKLVGGLAVNVGDMGMISADYERIDYGMARLQENQADVPFDYENDSIQQTFGAANNLRLGGELKLNSFYVRLGYALYQTPYEDNYSDYQSARQMYSGGIGFRESSFFIDAAFVTSSYTTEEQIFSTIPNVSEIDFTNNRFMLSVGLRF